MIMPKGGGLSYNHFKLTNLIFDWVDALPVGRIFTIHELSEYIQNQPLAKYSKRGYKIKGKDMKTRISNRGSLSDSNAYFASIVNSNCRDWNLRYGWLYGSRDVSFHAHGLNYIVHYLKTDNDGMFPCLFCEMNKIQLKPQWAYETLSDNKHKVILKEATCSACIKLGMGIKEWNNKRSNKNESKKMD
tara:strand:+ start:961 stop:1524 length:564 start_codon:yes stop_codon:yes gene_type:complete